MEVRVGKTVAISHTAVPWVIKATKKDDIMFPDRHSARIIFCRAEKSEHVQPTGVPIVH